MSAPASRPLSPHVQIYKPQISWVPSITHRMANMAMFFSIFFIMYALGSLAAGPEAYRAFAELASSGLVRFALFGWTFCFFYNMGHDIRHLFWDFGYGFELHTIKITAWSIVAFSVIATLLCWIMILG